jgi:hypothetical protein
MLVPSISQGSRQSSLASADESKSPSDSAEDVVGDTFVPTKIDDQQHPAVSKQPLRLLHRRYPGEVMHDDNGNNAIEVVQRKVLRHELADGELDIRVIRRSAPGKTHHVGRQVDAVDIRGPLGQSARQSAGAAANVQNVFAVFRNVPQ